MVQPTDWHVPKISFTVPFSSRAMLRGRMMRAIAITSFRDRLPLCAMFLTCATTSQRQNRVPTDRLRLLATAETGAAPASRPAGRTWQEEP